VVSSSQRRDILVSLNAQIARRRYYTSPSGPLSSLAARHEVAEFIDDHFDEIAADAEHATAPAPAPAQLPAAQGLPIFSYWADGFDRAPEIVRACETQLGAVHANVYALDAHSVRDLIDIPDAVAAGTEQTHPAHFSDYIRLALLERYGGIWVDATCWVPAPLTEPVTRRLGAGVLMPRWAPNQISNWFIAARPRNRVISLLRAGLTCWWRHHDRLPDYFLFHRVFAGVLNHDHEAREIWKTVPTLGSLPCHLLQTAMFRRYDEDEVRLLLGRALIQKLSWKYDADSVPPDSTLARILRGDGLPTPEADTDDGEWETPSWLA
jgi:hypothetical protein